MKCYLPGVGLGLLLSLFAGTQLPGAVIVTFSNGDAFDGDTAGDSAGPFVDLSTGVSFTINTVSTGGPGTALNTTAGRLGITGGSGTSANSRFNQNESWVLNFGANPIDFLGIDFGLFTGSETYRLESTAWANETFDAPGAAVTFSSTSTSGYFTFADNGSSDTFSLDDFSSSGMVSIDAGNDLVLSYTGSDTNGSVLESFSVQANPQAVPEPSALVLGTAALPLISLFKRYRKWRRVRRCAA